MHHKFFKTGKFGFVCKVAALMAGVIVLASQASEVPIQRTVYGRQARPTPKSPATKQKLTAVFHRGSDWCAAGEVLYRKVWRQRSFIERTTSIFELTEWDERDQPNECSMAGIQRLKDFAVRIDSFPAISFHLSSGRCFAVLEDLPHDLSAAALLQSFQRVYANYQKYIELIQRADDLQGADKSRHIMQAAEILLQNMSSRNLFDKNHFGALLDQIKDADPEDRSGAYWRLTFNGYRYSEEILKYVRDGKRYEAEKMIVRLRSDQRLQRLTLEQQQQIHLLSFIFLKEVDEKPEEQITILQTVISIQPGSYWGIAAESYLNLLGAGIPSLPIGWNQSHLTTTGRGRLTIERGVRQYFAETGVTYRIEVISESEGEMKIYGMGFVNNESEVQRAAQDAVMKRRGDRAVYEVHLPDRTDLNKLKLFVDYNVTDAPVACRLVIQPIGLSPLTGKITEIPDLGGMLKESLHVLQQRHRTLLRDRKVQAHLIRAKSIKGIEHETFQKISMLPDGSHFISTFLSDPEMMERFWASGPVTKPAESIMRLYWLWSRNPGGMVRNQKSNVWSKFAMAIALDHFRKYNEYDVVRVLDNFRTLSRQHRLHPQFFKYSVREMRFVFGGQGMFAKPYSNIREVMHLAKSTNSSIENYPKRCSRLTYRGYNFFGENIQVDRGYQFWRPWYSDYGFYQTIWEEGGVCGPISVYVSAVANVHGLMSVTIGQPGHCAYAIRGLDRVWNIHYYIRPFSFPAGFFWGSTFPYLALMEDVYADDIKQLNAMRLAWSAEMLPDQALDLYRAAVKICPPHYGIWEDYAVCMQANRSVPVGDWIEWSLEVSRALADHPACAWDLLMLYSLPEIQKEQGLAGLTQALIHCHRQLSQSKREVQETFDFFNLLQRQSQLLHDDDQLVFSLTRSLLDRYKIDNALFLPAFQFALRYISHPEYGPQVMNHLFSSTASTSSDVKEQVKMINAALEPLIKDAIKKQDVVRYHQLFDAVDQLWPIAAKGHSAFPDIQLISQRGLFSLSSSLRPWDQTLFYRRVVDDSMPHPDVVAHTQHQHGQWAKIELSGMCDLLGIYIEPAQGSVQRPDTRLLPFDIMISDDGLDWRLVATVAQPAFSYSIDLKEKQFRAKYVKVKCKPENKNYLILRKFQLYGVPHY